MSRDQIRTNTDSSDNATDQDYKPVTGTDVGTKRALDVNISGSSGSIDTELPDAVLAADDLANPTAPQVLSHNMVYDQASDNWDRARGSTGHDLDSGAGEELNLGVSIRFANSGGSDAAPGDATDGLLVNLGTNNDITVTSGNVTVDNAAGASAVNIQDGGNSITIDDGGSSITVDGTVSVTEPVSVDDNGGSLTVDNAALSVTGGGAEATALRVTLANDSTGVLSVDDNGSTLSVDDGGGSLTIDGSVSVSNEPSVNLQDGAGTDLTSTLVGADQSLDVNVTQSALPTGAATAANQLPDGHNVTIDNGALGSAVNIQDGGNSITVDGTVSISGVVSVDDNSGSLTVDDGGTTLSIDDGGATISVDATDLDIRDLTSASDSVETAEEKSATATTSQPSIGTTATTALASNASRLGATFYNGSGVDIYLKEGSGATTTDFTVKLADGDTARIVGPNIYTGILTAVVSSGSHTLQVTENT